MRTRGTGGTSISTLHGARGLAGETPTTWIGGEATGDPRVETTDLAAGTATTIGDDPETTAEGGIEEMTETGTRRRSGRRIVAVVLAETTARAGTTVAEATDGGTTTIVVGAHPRPTRKISA